jgi:L-iditol 2-dehydrogenase
VEVAFESAGTVPAQDAAARMLERGGTLVLVGIPAEDQLALTHHIVRRKGATLQVVRRMKHTYPRAIALVERQMVDLKALVTHRYDLAQGDAAFRLVEGYLDGVVKAVVRPS